LFQGAASYVDRILRSEKPTDLAVQAPIKFTLVVARSEAGGRRGLGAEKV
jgi:hypothetical protein